LTFIIAEAGVNHNGNPNMAFQLIDSAIEAGADAIKFQTFKPEKLVTKNASKADYQLKNSAGIESQYSMLKQLELSHETFSELAKYCENNGIRFLSTAFDYESLLFLSNDLCLKTLKISSGEISNAPLLLEHSKMGCDLILSTGMATLDEVKDALGVIAYGYIDGKDPSINSFRSAFLSNEGQSILKNKVTLLHCTTEYPAPLEDINLLAMQTMKEEFNLNVGYSDHSKGINVSIAATALGATVIEKHFTLDKTLPGPDHNASLDPEELKLMVNSIRDVEKAIGDGVKRPQPSELANRNIVRRSLVAAKRITTGEKFTSENVSIKRPGTGISPIKYWDLIGQISDKNYDEDDLLC
jgi:N-acetylneuraminate synthase